MESEPLGRRRVLALGGGAVLGTAGVVAGAVAAGAADAPGGGRESGTAAGEWRQLVVVTANIGRERLDQRERAVRDVRRAVASGDGLARPLVGWQEIGEGDGDARENAFIGRHFGDSYRNLFVGHESAHRVPMSVPRTFDVVGKRITLAHGGKGGVTPHRVITQAVLALASDPQLRFVFVNTHYVAGAWNGRDDPAEAWRRKMWRRHFRRQRDKVLAHWHAEGYPVVWTGDVNRGRMPLLVPSREKRAFPRGIDQIGWLPGTNGTQIRLKRTAEVAMHVDGHDARVAVMQIRRG